MRRGVLTVGLAVALGAAAGATERPTSLTIHASPLVVPCLEASASAYAAGRAVRIDTGGGPNASDLLVASDLEVTRALETGLALLDSDQDVAQIPWVLQVSAGNPGRVRSLEDALAQGLEVVLPKDVAAHEVRRMAEGRGNRTRQASDVRDLRSASAAVLPLSLAAAGDRIPTSLRPLHVRVAVLAGSKQEAAARAFAGFLASEPGQRVFAACENKR